MSDCLLFGSVVPQLNVFKPVMINSLLQSIRLLGDSCNSFQKNCLDGMSAPRTRA